MAAHVKKKKKTMLDALLLLLFLLCLAVFLYFGSKLLGYYLERKEADDSYDVLFDVINDLPRETPEDLALLEQQAKDENALPIISMDFDELHAINPDIVGWIRLDDTKIDYPILRAENNNYYLHHLYTGKYNDSGSIFMDCANDPQFRDGNTVIWGHHMNNGSMFKALDGYKEQEFFEEHPVIRLFTPQGDYLIEVFSGTIENGSEQFIRLNFDDEFPLEYYVNDLRERSLIQSDVEVNRDDRLISLCTCTYEKYNARFMVTGKLIPLTVKQG